MPLLSFFRLLASLVSLAVLGFAAWLLATWYAGDQVIDADGVVRHVRDDWRLWLGAPLLAWSFLGKWLLLPLITRRDERPTSAVHGEGKRTPGAAGSTLHVESHGPEGAPPIIFTHGWGLDSTIWRYAREDLADRFRLILWDLPGLGRSRPGSRNAITLSAFAADLAGLVRRHGGQRVVLVGHSIGGMVIQTLIREHPGIQDRLAGVVLLNTTYTNPLRTMLFGRLATALQRPLIEPATRLTELLGPVVRVSQWLSYLSGSSHLANRLGFGQAVTRSQLEHVTLLTTRNDPAAQARGNLAMFHWDASGALAQLYVPLLVIGGGVDIVTRPEASHVMAGHRGELVVVGDANHLGPLERAEVYHRQIADFVLRVQRHASSDARRVERERGGDRPAGGEASLRG